MTCDRKVDDVECRMGNDCSTCPMPSFVAQFANPEGPIFKLATYTQSSSVLYHKYKGDDRGLKYDAARLIQGLTTEELRCLLFLFRDFARDQKYDLRLKTRAGMRRGWDILNVACMSRY